MMVPAVALAGDEEAGVLTQDELASALQNASTDETNPTVIEVAASFSIDQYLELPEGRHVTLKGVNAPIISLNDGSYVNWGKGQWQGMITLRNGSTLKLQDITFDAQEHGRCLGGATGDSKTTVTLSEGSTLKNGLVDNAPGSGAACRNVVLENGATVDNCDITGGDWTIQHASAVCGISVTVNGGTVKDCDGAIGAIGSKSPNGELYVNGGSFVNNGNDSNLPRGYAIDFNATSSASLNSDVSFSGNYGEVYLDYSCEPVQLIGSLAGEELSLGLHFMYGNNIGSALFSPKEGATLTETDAAAFSKVTCGEKRLALGLTGDGNLSLCDAVVVSLNENYGETPELENLYLPQGVKARLKPHRVVRDGYLFQG